MIRPIDIRTACRMAGIPIALRCRGTYARVLYPTTAQLRQALRRAGVPVAAKNKIYAVLRYRRQHRVW